MNLEEYKAKYSNTKEYTLPSGLMIKVKFPTPLEFLDAGVLEETQTSKILKKFVSLLKIVEPEGLTIEDLNFNDFIYLTNLLGSFFGEEYRNGL